jgi:hypothetical protein
MDIETVIALLGVLISVGSLAIAFYTSRASAKKDEVDALRGIIAELRVQVNKLESEVRTWQRRFVRVCNRAGLDPDDNITGPLGDLGTKAFDDG